MFQELGNRMELAAGLGLQALVQVDAEEVRLSMLQAELNMVCD